MMFSYSYYCKKVYFYLKHNKRFLFKKLNNFLEFKKKQFLKYEDFINILGTKNFTIAKSTAESIDIIIPIYNGINFLDPLFLSIKNSTDNNYRLIIINDCSTDVTIDNYLREFNNKFPLLKHIIIKNEQNLGFVKSVNKAYGFVESKIFVILNTDVEVPSGWLSRIIRPLMLEPKYASATPCTNSGEIFSFPVWLKNNELLFEMDVNEVDGIFQRVCNNYSFIDVPTGIGFCMAIRKSVVEQIGFLDDVTFAKGYGEENDWCMRASNIGYKHAFVTNLFVYHKHGGSFGFEEKKLLLEENSLKLVQKHPYFEERIFDFIKDDPLKYHRALLIYYVLIHKKDRVIYKWGDLPKVSLSNKVELSVLKYNKNTYLIQMRFKHINLKFIINSKKLLANFINDFNINLV